MDPDAVQKVVERNVFNYLDHSVAKIAKTLHTNVTTGRAVGSSTAGVYYPARTCFANVSAFVHVVLSVVAWCWLRNTCRVQL